MKSQPALKIELQHWSVIERSSGGDGGQRGYCDENNLCLMKEVGKKRREQQRLKYSQIYARIIKCWVTEPAGQGQAIISLPALENSTGQVCI